jgi:hypothetical protein
MHIAKMLCDVRVEDDEKFEHLLTRKRGWEQDGKSSLLGLYDQWNQQKWKLGSEQGSQ